jgi:hypothetical protein
MSLSPPAAGLLLLMRGGEENGLTVDLFKDIFV